MNYISNYVECDGLYIRGDAEIVIRQMNGEYQVRSPNVRPYYNEAQNSLGYVDYEFVYFRHVSRSDNWEADELANEAIDD